MPDPRPQQARTIQCQDHLKKFSRCEDRIIRIRVNGAIFYSTKHNVHKIIIEPFADKFGTRPPGFTDCYQPKEMVRGDFNLKMFLVSASEEQIDWLLQRMPENLAAMISDLGTKTDSNN